MPLSDIYVVSAVRTPIGTFGGSLKDCTPEQLGALVARAAVERAGVAPDLVSHTVFGQVIPTKPADAYMARMIAVNAGIPHAAPALTVNRLCGSGLQAVISAAQTIALGDSEIALAGGTEVMSRAPFFAPAMRWGQRMGDSALVDGLNGARTDPFDPLWMGVTAENVAERCGIDRARQDALAVESHRRASAAIEAGLFADQIVDVDRIVKRQPVRFARDEHVRADADLAGMAALRTIFREQGTVTAGNSSGINDGAGAVILASGAAVRRRGLRPMPFI